MDDKKKKQQNGNEEVKEAKVSEEVNETKEVKVDQEAEKIKVRVEELENQNKRVLADYRNLENRVGNERGEWMLKANKQLLLNLLPVLDTLMLAAKHSQGKDNNLALSIQQFLDILKKEGVVKIETTGASFDPNQMDGIQTIEGEEGKVIEEVRAGYMLYDKVLRPAQVKVGKGK